MAKFQQRHILRRLHRNCLPRTYLTHYPVQAFCSMHISRVGLISKHLHFDVGSETVGTTFYGSCSLAYVVLQCHSPIAAPSPFTRWLCHHLPTWLKIVRQIGYLCKSGIRRFVWPFTTVIREVVSEIQNRVNVSPELSECCSACAQPCMLSHIQSKRVHAHCMYNLYETTPG